MRILVETAAEFRVTARKLQDQFLNPTMATMKRTASAAFPVGWLLGGMILLVSITGMPLAAAATSPDEPQDKSTASSRETLEELKRPFGEDEPEEGAVEDGDEDAGIDLCDRDLSESELQEQSQELIRSWSCHSFRWFDSWWGDRYDFDEKAVNGLVTVGARYTEYYGLDEKLRIRVRAPLPNLTRRWDLIFGRVDEEAFVTDTQGQDRTFYNPGAVDRGEEDAWLLGLGHRGKKRKSGWDYSVGVRLRLPPEPYVKAQWYYNKDLSERSDFRFRQTFFWRSDRGFGLTSRGDLAYALDDKNVLRWEAWGTDHDKTEGVSWYAGQTWYHLLANRSAFSLRAFVRGETDAEVQPTEYGIDMIWRRPFTREWLYLSVGPSVTWPREHLDERREMSLGFNLWLEMEFGNWRY